MNAVKASIKKINLRDLTSKTLFKVYSVLIKILRIDKNTNKATEKPFVTHARSATVARRSRTNPGPAAVAQKPLNWATLLKAYFSNFVVDAPQSGVHHINDRHTRIDETHRMEAREF